MIVKIEGLGHDVHYKPASAQYQGRLDRHSEAQQRPLVHPGR